MDAGAALIKLFGGLLLAAGTLIALSCGLCTGYFGIYSVVMLFDEGTRNGILFTSPFLVAGLFGTAVGVGLVWGGLAILRASPQSSGDSLTDRGE